MATDSRPVVADTETSMLETQVRVSKKELVADGIAVLELTDPHGLPLPEWQAGAHIDLILDDGPVRQYSLCGDPTQRHVYRVGVLRDPAGQGGSIAVHDKLTAGSDVTIRGPRNHFPLVDAQRILFVAGGIGITPILPMIAAADAAGHDWHLLYGGRQLSSMAFRDELAQYGSRVNIRPQDEYGLLDIASFLGEPCSDTAVYCCGPEPLIAAVESTGSAWPAGSIHFERFAPKAVEPPVLDVAFEVVCARSDLHLVVEPDETIFDVVADAGVNIAGSCFEGTCGTCEVTVLEGDPDHQDSILTPEQQASKTCMMICVSRSRSPRLVLDI